MARRRFRVDTIISILRRLQRGESCRSIARAGLAGRNKVQQIKKVAREKGWLGRAHISPAEEGKEHYGNPCLSGRSGRAHISPAEEGKEHYGIPRKDGRVDRVNTSLSEEGKEESGIPCLSGRLDRADISSPEEEKERDERPRKLTVGLRADIFPLEEELAEALIIPVLCTPQQESRVEPYREKVAEWVSQGIRTKTIFDALKRQNPPFDGSYGSVLRFIRRLRGAGKLAFVPLSFEPGECAQVDFGSGPVLLNPVTGQRQKTHFFIMTLCFSRHIYVEFVWDQKVKTWQRCHKNAFEWFGGVPGKIIIDNLKSAITRACRYDPAVQRSYEEFAGAYGFIISPCEPRKPRHKGRVEAGVKYVKRSFLPLRDFRDSISEANRQVRQWILEVGNRIHGTTKRMPLKVFTELDKPALLPLPESAQELSVWACVKVHSDCHITYENAYYSAPYEYVGQTLWLSAGERLILLYVEKNGRCEQVALHPIAGKPGERHTNISHLPPEKVSYLLKNPQWCRAEADKVGKFCRELIDTLLDSGVTDHLRAVQGILRLGEKFGSARLESACRRALFFDNITYSAIKRILKQGMDQLPLDDTPLCRNHDGRFSRDIAELLHPEKKTVIEVERSIV